VESAADSNARKSKAAFYRDSPSNVPRVNLSMGRTVVAIIAILMALQLSINFVRERTMISEIEHEPSSVVCIGRVLVDMPSRLITTYGMTYFAGWHITTSRETEVDFLERLKGRVSALENSKNEYGSRSLELSKEAGASWKGSILRFDRESLRSVYGGVVSYKDIVKIEGHVHSQGTSFDISGGVRYEGDIDKLENLVSRLRVREPDSVPLESGFCIDRGVIVGSENLSRSEGITVFAGYENSKDVSVVIDSTAGTKAPDTLLQRIAASTIRKEFPSSFKNLRIGARQISEHKGEEVLTRVIEDDGRSNHKFVWESIPEKKDIYRPQITMELSTGFNTEDARNKTPFTDREAVALWDRITASLRNRPVTAPANHVD
jgi:hypothetical protein